MYQKVVLVSFVAFCICLFITIYSFSSMKSSESAIQGIFKGGRGKRDIMKDRKDFLQDQYLQEFHNIENQKPSFRELINTLRVLHTSGILMEVEPGEGEDLLQTVETFNNIEIAQYGKTVCYNGAPNTNSFITTVADVESYQEFMKRNEQRKWSKSFLVFHNIKISPFNVDSYEMTLDDFVEEKKVKGIFLLKINGGPKFDLIQSSLRTLTSKVRFLVYSMYPTTSADTSDSSSSRSLYKFQILMKSNGYDCFFLSSRFLIPFSGYWWQEDYQQSDFSTKRNIFCIKEKDPEIKRITYFYNGEQFAPFQI